MQQFHGILPAVVTPLAADGGLNAHAFIELIDRLYEAGSHGLYVCGQTGEGLQLPLKVRERAVEVAVERTPEGRTVIVHVGASNTADAVRLARHASVVGAQAISSLPPVGVYSFTEVKAYYEAIASESSVPVLVYYFPEFSASIKTIEDVFELCMIPNVVGLKFTDFDLYRMSLIERAGLTIYSGRDEVLAAGLLMGAHGGIGSFYNLAPELFVEIYEHAQAGRWKEAREAQDRVNDLIRAVLGFPMLAAIKRLLTWSGIDCGVPMAPKRPLTGAEEAALKVAVERAGFRADRFLAMK